MLLFSRKAGDRTDGVSDTVLTLPTGERVTVTVLDIQGGTVRLGIDAPASVVVNRGEVQRRKDDGKR